MQSARSRDVAYPHTIYNLERAQMTAVLLKTIVPAGNL